MIIYKATNKINGKSYIGQTIKNLEKRKRLHCNSAKRKNNNPFHCAIRKYGIENFEWEEIAWANTIEKLNEYEIRMIDFYNSKAPNGYNLTDGGENNPGSNPEIRKRMVATWKKNYTKEKHPFFGKKRPEHSALMKEKTKGENNPNWKGGVSFDEYPQEFDHKLKTQIRERDNYTCQLCMEYGNIVHHIDYNKRHCHPNNLITLCLKDNLKVNHNRTQWEIYFRLYMMFKKG